ncbi:diacylglycerol kinase [Zwartia sp.]|uniref:diacylglycerol kinase n=1 Tax=Zwartia sp. TaxID=2978004 RepID=UPI002725F8EF|nr:diacylglycerol kinase [Zwartia sp.]MDO9023528.1 diacylglycerol kinase [Zwartia sp.]
MSSHPSQHKSKGGFSRVFKAAGYSVKGLGAALRYEAAFRQELFLALILTPAAFWVGENALQIILLLSTLVIVLIVELLNSAIESVADAVTLDNNLLIGRAKDLGSAAVLLSLLMTAAIWIALLINKWFPFI